MAISLSSERPIVAAGTTGFAAQVRSFFQKAVAMRARRAALATLLELEQHRLDDLGLCRQDLIDALRSPSSNTGRQLAHKRSVRASR